MGKRNRKLEIDEPVMRGASTVGDIKVALWEEGCGIFEVGFVIVGSPRILINR